MFGFLYHYARSRTWYNNLGFDSPLEATTLRLLPSPASKLTLRFVSRRAPRFLHLPRYVLAGLSLSISSQADTRGSSLPT
jgi:hypothetical protein